MAKEHPGGGEARHETERAPRDNRRIVSGVQLVVEGILRTFGGNSPEDHDALEAVLTPEQVEHLKTAGALEGDWHGKGKPAEPMAGSLAARAESAGEGGLAAQVEALKKENAQLRKAAATPSGGRHPH